MIKVALVRIKDMFEVIRGKSEYTRAYALQNPGTTPIYSAALNAPLAFSSQVDYRGRYLTCTVNGYAGCVQVLYGSFSINSDRAIFLPVVDEQELPDFDYLAAAIERTLRKHVVGRQVDGIRNEYTKISPAKILNSEIEIPITDSGAMDLELMLRIGNKLRAQNRLKLILKERKESILSSDVLIDIDSPFREITLGDRDNFTLSIGKRLKKSEISNTGIPVYSANVRNPFGYLPVQINESFSRPSLIWGIDGHFDWNIIQAGEAFIPTDHCGRLQILCQDIDPEYLLFELSSTKEEYGFDRVFRASLGNIANVRVRIPIDKSGNFDLLQQKKLASKHRKIEEAREKVISCLDEVLAIRIVPSILKP